MSHPYNAHRDHKVQHKRVDDIAAACGGRMAVGGAAHDDEAADKALIHKMVKKRALRATGGAVKARSDRPSRAWGGRSPKKKFGSKHTTNVIVAPHPPGMGMAPAMPRPAVVPGVAAGPPPMAPRPVVPPPPMAGGPMGGPPGISPLPPGVPPPGIRRHGGRNYKKGGAVFSDGTEESFTAKGKDDQYSGGHLADANTAGIGKGRTPLQHARGKQDGRNIGRKDVITKATGGPVLSPEKAGVGMGPEFTGGGGGGTARLEKAARLGKKGYGKPSMAIKNPTQNPKP